MNIFQKKLIPNYLTIFRIILIPLVVTFMLLTGSHCKGDKTLYHFKLWDGVYYINLYWFIGGVLFVIASFTDFLDGFLARKYKWVSDWGKIWDPLADKILVNTVLVLMGSQFKGCGQTIIFIPIIKIIRDILVDGYRMSASSKGIVVAANIYGKLKTIVQMMGIIVIFFVFNETPNVGWARNKMYYIVQNMLLYISTILSIVSGIIYIVRINKQKKNAKKL